MVDHALAKIDRAAKHVAELSELLRKKRPFRYVLETNEKTGECATFAERDEAIISELSDISYSAVQKLRTALDYAYWEIVSPFAATERERKSVQFPFSETENRLDECVKNRLAHRVSDSFFNAIIVLAPHGEAGGNELLYAVHSLAAGERHRFPAPVADYKTVSGRDLLRQIPHFPTGLAGSTFTLSNNRRDIGWRIQPLPFLPSDVVHKRELDVPIDVVFRIGSAQDFKQMVPTLHAMVNKTKEAIEIIRSA